MEKVSLDLYAATAAKVVQHLSAGDAVDLDGYCLTPDDDGTVWIDKPNGSDGGSFALSHGGCERLLSRLQSSGRTAVYAAPPRPDTPLVEIDDEDFDDELDVETPPEEERPAFAPSMR